MGLSKDPEFATKEEFRSTFVKESRDASACGGAVYQTKIIRGV